ncbi:MAG TPA: DUF2652 domain-containing protein [Kofleriaceae bacterium]|nr:DUF2652 domain-containing protein [Kofleriaceae bacterium]
MASERVLMVIADIGGYTRFMRVHKINLAHAQYVVTQLMEAILDALGRRWKLAKLEGDAAFVYRRLGDGEPLDGGELRRRVLDIAGAFRARQAQLAAERTCACDGCMQAGQLTLKFVAHAGEALFHRVKRMTELAGVDVILVHRLLKNSVPIDEYVLCSDEVHRHLAAELSAPAVPIEEDLEGLGARRLYYVDLAQLGPIELPAAPRSRLRAVLRWLHMTVRSLPYMVGLRRPPLDAEALAAICPPGEELAPAREA